MLSKTAARQIIQRKKVTIIELLDNLEQGSTKSTRGRLTTYLNGLTRFISQNALILDEVDVAVAERALNKFKKRLAKIPKLSNQRERVAQIVHARCVEHMVMVQKRQSIHN